MTIKRILIAQTAPAGASPYAELAEKYNVAIEFYPFIHVERLSGKEFRTQRVDILNHTAIVFISRSGIDHFFGLCEELRIVIPEAMKYFCLTEAIAFYLQKYIVYRKRKIFYGNGTIESVIEAIGPKHKGEIFLLALASNSKPEISKTFEKAKIKHTKAILYRTENSDLSHIKLSRYNMLVFYSAAEVKSLIDNFPDFKQNGTKLATFGPATLKALKAAKLKAAIEAPTPEAPSMTKALELFLAKQ
ncbi:MAG: uroporphyrinogen-III synthase [Prevotellaceae bacterium]|jgi:uroporphyrinogen-III synthase|nr:uroporphyrinogen-III synthase [Prevotellaceae bacterium]